VEDSPIMVAELWGLVTFRSAPWPLTTGLRRPKHVGLPKFIVAGNFHIKTFRHSEILISGSHAPNVRRSFGATILNA
jgi:hypothetical protein